MDQSIFAIPGSQPRPIHMPIASRKRTGKTDPAPNRDELLEWRGLEIVFAQNNNVSTGGLVAFAIVAAIFWNQVPKYIWFGWLLGYSLLLFYRTRKMAEYASNRDRDSENLARWRRRVDLTQLTTGTMWGLLLFYLMIIGSTSQAMAITMLMTAMVTGGLIAYSYRQPTYLMFSSGICLPPVGGMFLREEPMIVAGILGAFWFIYLWSFSRKFADFYLRSVRLNLANKELTEDLEQRNQEVSELNRSLHRKVEELGESNSHLLTEQERIEAFAAELARLSTTDPLTNISNRRSFELALEKAWRRGLRRGREVGLIMLDVDHFKAYNDNYGHQQGDQCLVDVARILASNCSPEDCVARYGGEEFVVLLPHTTHFEALDAARDFISRIAAAQIRHEHSPVAPYLTASAGMSVARPGALTSPDKLLQNADKALYEAKRAGRNQVVSDRTEGVLANSERPVIELDDIWDNRHVTVENRARPAATSDLPDR